jgi:UDP-N-acetylmuramoyl-tripeptide--D-alanyl-D-alanine ligase
MEFFTSVEAIAEEKGEIFAGLVPGGTAIVNRDAQYFRLLRRKAESYGASRVVGFGAHSEADARLLAIEPAQEGVRVTAMILGKPLTYRLGAPGRHWAENSLAVLAAADAVGADLERAAASLARVKPAKGRGARARIPLAGGSIELIDESYNANPASMRAALALLGEAEPGQGGRRIAVLGDMLELGAEAARFHRDLAPEIERARIDLVFTAGPLMSALDAALPSSRRGAHAERSADLAAPLTRALRSGDVVMVKGSFGSKMGAIVEALHARAPQEA